MKYRIGHDWIQWSTCIICATSLRWLGFSWCTVVWFFCFISQWLNNCVGRKNYVSFVLLMTTGLVLVWKVFILCDRFTDIPWYVYFYIYLPHHWFLYHYLFILQLVMNWGIGIAVFVRCFVDKHDVDKQIVEKLGNGFSRILFAIIVVRFK